MHVMCCTLVWGKIFTKIALINSEFDRRENKDCDLYEVQQLMLNNDIKAQTHHNSNESWLLCHQKAALEHNAKMTANNQLACTFCECIRGNNSQYHQVEVDFIPVTQ